MNRTEPGTGAPSADLSARLRAYVDALGPALAPAATAVLSPDRARTVDPGGIRIVVRASWVAELLEIDDPDIIDQGEFAMALLAAHTLLQDQRIDRDGPDPGAWDAGDLLGSLCLADGLARCSAIARDERFWADVHASLAELAEAYAREARHAEAFDRLPEVGEPAAVTELAAGRSAPFKILVSALACHAGRRDRQAAVNAAVGRAFVGLHMRDDLSDWRSDHARGRTSSLLLRLAGTGTGKPLRDSTPDELADALYLRGGLERLLVESTARLRAALDPVADFPHTRYRAYLDSVIEDNTATLDRATRRKWEFLAGGA